MSRTSLDEGGFTLVEIIFVLAIIGIALIAALPAVERYIERTREVEAVLAIGEMSEKIKSFERSSGALPNGLAAVGYGGKLDPWGKPYEYLNLVTGMGNGQARKDKKPSALNSDFDLYSLGKDGLTNASLANSVSRDDVLRARDGAFIGLAAEVDP